MSQGAPIAFDFQVRGDQQVKASIQGMGGALSQLDNTASRASESATKVQRNYSQAALGLSTAASGAASLYFQYDNLEKAETRIATAEKQVDAARAAVLTSQNALNALVAKGITDGPVYEAVQLRVSAAQQELAIAGDKANQAQGDLTQSQLQFGLNVIPTVLGAVTSLSAAKGLLTASTITGTGAQATQTTVNLGSIGSFTALSASTTGAALATRGYALAVRLAQLATGPLGIAMIAIGTVFTLVATNAFGIRDALDSFAKKVESIFPILKPVFDFFRGIASTLFPDTKEKTDDLSQTFDTQFDKMSKTVDTSTGAQVGALGSLSDQFVDTNTVASQNMSTLASNVSTQADSIVESARRAREAMASIGAAPDVTTPAAASPTFQQLGPGGGIDVASGAFMSTPTTPVTSLPSTFQQLGPTGGIDLASGAFISTIHNNNTTYVSVQLDGQDIAAKIDKKTVSGLLGRT